MDAPLDRLREQISGFPTEPYLLTVTEASRPHCGTVSLAWDANGQLLVDAPSSWPGSASSGHSVVSLLWPPGQPGGYSLIVDGTAEQVGSKQLAVTVTRGVLHRRGQPDPGSTPGGSTSCGHDCVPIVGP
jgi:hypothetical protein